MAKVQIETCEVLCHHPAATVYPERACQQPVPTIKVSREGPLAAYQPQLFVSCFPSASDPMPGKQISMPTSIMSVSEIVLAVSELLAIFPAKSTVSDDPEVNRYTGCLAYSTHLRLKPGKDLRLRT